MLLLKMAFLNIWRHPKRSLMTILAAAVGIAAMIFLQSFLNTAVDEQRDNAIRLFTGHVQVQSPGFHDKLAPELILKDRSKVLALNQSSEVLFYSERILAEALVGTSENSRGALLLGVDPDKEPQITEISHHVSKGKFLASGDDKSILLGTKLAEKVGAGIGDKVVVMGQAMDGSLTGYSYRVQGILSAKNKQLDELTALVTLTAARKLLDIGDASHQVVFKLKGRTSIESFLEKVKASLPEAGYQTRTWDQIIPEINQWAKWEANIIHVVLLCMMIIVTFGVVNTILMSVHERTKELGIMLAIGTSPERILKLIFLETLFLQLIGIAIGLLVGVSLVAYFGAAGIRFDGVDDAFAMSYMSAVTRPQLDLNNIFGTIACLLATTSFLGLYPAWKASKTEPIKAIYHL